MWNKKDFLRRKEDIIRHFKKAGVSRDTISGYCTLAGIPITVVCEFILEEMPEHKKLCKDYIKSLREFYGFKEKTCGFCSEKCDNEYCVTEDE